jgi:hypothetical protein
MSLELNLLKDVDVSGKRVFIRINLNVPLDKKNTDVTNTNRVPLDVREVQTAIRKRIGCALPTINYCLEKGAKSVVLASHIGRPGGAFAKKYSLEPVATELEKQIRKQVIFLKNCVGPEVEDVCASPAPGYLSLSLSISLPLSLSRSRSLFLFSFSFFLSLSRARAHSLSFSLSLSRARTLSLSLSLSLGVE